MKCQIACSQRFLICSIGNPGTKYRFTRHSLGHYILEQIRSHFGFSVFRNDLSDLGMYAENENLPFLLFQSNVFMNESGKAVQKAWNKFCLDTIIQKGKRPVLVILHDDIEEEFGTVKIRERGKGRGHKGVQSCIKSLLTESFVRFSIGLGRPLTRESKNVIKFVLQKLSPQELDYINEITVPKVVREIEKLKNRVKTE
ncbi:hypothetical protein PMAC_000043 [Pneumocystis sp. 'macacae']|nr:hypothetical protein PMAC_000043 [Pneumocystis sp. 'macacae']